MADFKSLLNKSKANGAASGATSKSKLSKLPILHGTGMTKKVATKSTNEFKRDEKKLDIALAKPTRVSINLSKTKPTTQTPDELDVPILAMANTISDEITLDEYQSKALNGLRDEKFGCLIGAAGTGKTTVLKQLVAEIEDSVPTIDLNAGRIGLKDGVQPDYNVAICFCAFTGRAVQQMKRALPTAYHSMCNTAHATLGYMPETEEREIKDKKGRGTGEFKDGLVFRPTFTATNQLPYKICIVDEAGMMPINLWNELIAALPSDCRVILVGDINQLPPVQGRSVLGFAMTKWPTYTLEHIHRQAADNPIIANAHKILQGHFPQKDAKKFAIVTMPDGSVKTLREAKGVIKHLHQKGLFDPKTDAIIVPQNADTLGQENLNDELVTYFNPPRTDEGGNVLNKRQIITAGYVHVCFAEGDKVMLLQNDRERGLTNGMTGHVVHIALNGAFHGDRSAHAVTLDTFDGQLDLSDMAAHLEQDTVEEEQDANQRQASHIMTVRFMEGTDAEQEVDFSTAGQFKKVRTAYAFTCHKSQGGEYPTVIIIAHSANIRMLNREWLYTAVTRAQERVILLTNDRGLSQAINIQRIKGRTVAEKAAQFIALQDSKDTSVPNLPQPGKV